MGLLAFIVRHESTLEDPRNQNFSRTHASVRAPVTVATTRLGLGTRAPKRPDGNAKSLEGFWPDINLTKYGWGVNCVRGTP
jgi:hypothetical protein